MEQQAAPDGAGRRRSDEPDRTDVRRAPWRAGDGPRRPVTSDADRVPSWLAKSAAWGWRLLILLVVSGAVVATLTRLSLVVLPVVLAIILATLGVPPARRLEARGFPRALAAGTVVLGGIAIIGGTIAALTPAFSTQFDALQPTLAAAFERIFEVVEASPLDYDRDDLAELLNQIGARLGGGNGEVAEQVAAGAVILAELLTGTALALVLLFFLVKDAEQIVAWCMARTAPRYRDLACAAGNRAWEALSGFVRGTLFIATVDAVLIGIGLAVLRVPLVLPLALLVFLGAFVPVIGAFVSGLVAVLVALADGGPLTALAVLAVVVAVQQVEGQVLQPVLVRRSVALHPVVVLLAILAGAVLAGLVGALLAVPLSAVLSAVANELRLRAERFDGDVTAGGPDPLGPERVGYTTPPPTALERRRANQ